MIAVVAVFGCVDGDTVFEPTCRHQVRAGGRGADPAWTYALALLIVSKLVNSQAGPSRPWCPSRCRSASPGYVAFARRPTATTSCDVSSDLATIQFDRSGTTRIGKYVINHSFILPGSSGCSLRAWSDTSSRPCAGWYEPGTGGASWRRPSSRARVR